MIITLNLPMWAVLVLAGLLGVIAVANAVIAYQAVVLYRLEHEEE